MKNLFNSNIIVHRGKVSRNIVENTIPAIMKAVELGYAVELDVRLLKDNIAVVFHDANLKRMTGVNNYIKNYTYEELKKIKVKNKYVIPKLEQVLNLVNGRVPVILDIKGNKDNYILEEELLKLLSNYNGLIFIQSFQVKSLNWLWKKERKYLYGLIILNYLQLTLFTKLWIKFRYDFISCYIGAVKSKSLQRLRKNKILIGWTIIDKKNIERYRNLCDNFICENIQ